MSTSTNVLVKAQLTKLADDLYAQKHSFWEIVIAVQEWTEMMERDAGWVFGSKEDYLRLKLEASLQVSDES